MWDPKKNNSKHGRTYTSTPRGKLEYSKFRVRTPIRTFRDLDVYKDTTRLAADIFNLKIPSVFKKLNQEFELLYGLAKNIPRLIAESYGNKFDNYDLSQAKLEKVSEIISDIIVKIDFIIVSCEKTEVTVRLAEFLKKYQLQRRKILNLKNAWQRVHLNYQKNQVRS